MSKYFGKAKRIFNLSKFCYAKLGQVKGSHKDPFLYLGGILAVLIGLAVFAGGNFPFLAKISLPFEPSADKKPASAQQLFTGQKGALLPESPDLVLIQGSALKGASPPSVFSPQVLGALIGEGFESEVRREIIEYTIEEGDSLWSIALKFGISVDTIVWANDVTSALIRPGQKLFILPVSGVMHLVSEGDTVTGIAEKYKTDAEKIITFNDLASEGDVFVGEVLIIPDGKMASYSAIQPVDSSALSRLSTNNFYGQSHDYPYGQCTWWVAQKRAIPSWGHAKDWLNNAIASGYSVCKGRYCVPRVGAVISLTGHRIYEHVGYVEQVKGNKVVFSEMNYIGWGRMNYRTLTIGDFLIKGYIY